MLWSHFEYYPSSRSSSEWPSFHVPKGLDPGSCTAATPPRRYIHKCVLCGSGNSLSILPALPVAHCPIPSRRREPENNLRGEHACPRNVGGTVIPRSLPFRPFAKATYDTIHPQLQPPLCVAFAHRLAVCLRAPFKKLIATCASFLGIFRNSPPLLHRPIHWRPPPPPRGDVGPSFMHVMAPLRSRFFTSLSVSSHTHFLTSPLFSFSCAIPRNDDG